MYNGSKRILTVFLTALLLAPTVSVVRAESLQKKNISVPTNVEAWDSFPHPYLTGILSEETGEITITGFKSVWDSNENAYVLDFENMIPRDVVIPDYIGGYPVTEIMSGTFNFEPEENYPYAFSIRSLTIGDNVRRIGSHAFQWSKGMETVSFGKNVEVIEQGAFAECDRLHVVDWGDSLREIGNFAFIYSGNASPQDYYCAPLPPTVEFIGYTEICCQDNYVIPASVKEYDFGFCARSLIVLSKDMRLKYTESNSLICRDSKFPYYYFTDANYIYCYAGSTAEENAKMHGYTYYLIDGDTLLYDGKAVEGGVLHLDKSMTEDELRQHLGVDGTSSEIQIDGLRNGKVVNGTTVTLFHTVAQAPGKVYTVEKELEPVSVSVETLPAKTSYFYKEAFDPAGLSLRVTYDDGTQTVITDGFTLTCTDLAVGSNTITATFDNTSVSFPVTVRYAWWQHLIRIFLFGFLWY